MPRLFYTAGKLGAEMGISAKTVIHFEKRGLISPSFRDHNNWRRYTNRHKAEMISLLTGRIPRGGAEGIKQGEGASPCPPRSQTE
ncbi:MAG: MerR family DNA-binding transcriptional regulator [Planctomycetes bacterium]|nr:MerR family DNA-binding transcriptional regulator [Planctomycetota bacterium]